MHPGDNIYRRAGVVYGNPSNITVPTKPLVNESRRAETLAAKELGMTRKRYRKYLKKKGE